MRSTPPTSVFLIGFMAAGKTTVGRRLAEVLGRPFIDLDAAVEAVAGRKVRDIFAAEGEAGFRAREREALGRVVEGVPAVVATGGGTPCFADALALMREGGVVVALTAPLEEVARRVVDPSSRPLLAGPAERLQELFEQRAAIYRHAHFGVRTEGRTIEQVVGDILPPLRVAAALPPGLADPVLLALGERSYPVVIAAGGLAHLGALARRRLGARCAAVALVTDATVEPLYAAPCQAGLEAAGFRVARAVVPAGEPSKSVAELGRVAEALAAAGLDRSSAVLALGGGVVGDLAGFAAAGLYRGVAWAQVPTTLVAMIDSAIGGKTGVNLDAGKNLLGAFWQPAFVLADPDVLATLPARERRAAVGELVKYGLLDGEELLARVEAVAPALAAGGPTGDELVGVIRRCAGYKAWIVSRDERERGGERALLNLGHTVGHAIEAAAGYGSLLHGEAVALGLLAAARVSARLGLCDPALEGRVGAALRAAGLDAELAPWLRDDVLARLGADKKRSGANLRFVTLKGVGAPAVTELPLAELTRILRP